MHKNSAGLCTNSLHKSALLFCNKQERRGKGSTGRPPMSRRGNCLDNAPMESFFGHFKDEVDYKEAESLADLHTLVLEYMNHYNHTRKQWTLKKMTPASYRSHLIAA